MKRAPEKPARVASPATHPLVLLADALHEVWDRHVKRDRRCRTRFTRKRVHRSRVQIRRLISLLGLLQGLVPAKDLRKARRLLKRHHALTRDLRDVQVGLKSVKRLARELPEAAAFVVWLRKRRNRLGTRARSALRRRGGKRLSQLMQSIEASLRKRAGRLPPHRAAIRLQRNLDLAFDRVVLRDRRVDPADTTTIHCTRVALKRFAYMAGAAAQILPGLRTGPRDALKRLMSAMGSIQDNEVLLAALVRFERRAAARGGSVMTLRAELMRRRSEMIGACLKARTALRKFMATRPAA